MKTRSTLSLGAISLLLSAAGFLEAAGQEPAPRVPGAEFHVSWNGKDSNPGTREKPIATLERARDAVRALKAERDGKLPAGGVTVWLHGGRYELAQTFVLGPEDSGQEGAPVVYRAHPGEQPILSGGRVIGGWRKVTEDLPNLPAAAKGKVWSAEVPEARNRKWPFRQLWKNGQRLTRARWPNEQETSFRVVDASAPSKETLLDPAAIERWKLELRRSWRIMDFKDSTSFPAGRLPADLANGSAELFCRNAGRWATMRIPIASVDGTQLHLSEPAGVLSYYWGGMALMCAFEGTSWYHENGTGYIENALSLLDHPGEWYLDRQAGRVYYIPPEGENPNVCEFVASRVEQLLCLRGTPDKPIRHVELYGLAFEHAEWPLPAFGYRPTLGCIYGTECTPLVTEPPLSPGSIRSRDEFPEFALPAALDLMYAHHCRLELCRVSRVGASGIGLGEGCAENQLIGCEVFDAGGNGIHIGMPHGPICAEDFVWKQPGDEPQNNEIRSCYIHHTGQMDWGAYGILNSYANRTRIAHNLIEQQPYSAIAACFSKFVFPTRRDSEVSVEYNHLHHVMQKLFDGGAIYAKDGVARSSVIRGNLIHDISDDAVHNQKNGIFLDDGSYGFRVEDNIFHHIATAIRFNNCSKEKFSWGANYFGLQGEAVQCRDENGGAVDLGKLRVEDAPPALRAKAGPEKPYRSQWPAAAVDCGEEIPSSVLGIEKHASEPRENQ